ncbi:chymotrypsin-2-like [Trichogramma pretiosum]|uniref:chymotrypsin-2-like n=1 Tax=Trichogramma pretiosum TaxID=7493 RepID=UPI0006C975CF|nr:chymotrypsin-2-like [Trichogramma pretiosum]
MANHRLLIVSSWLCVLLVGSCHANNAFGTRILGGDEADNEFLFPYHVYLTLGHGKYVCGGSIIGDYHVLTAAHCVMKNSREFHDDVLQRGLNVVAGTSNLRDLRAEHAKTRRVVKMYVPKAYDLGRLRGDIAVLKLNEPLGLNVFTNQLQEVALPPKENTNYAGQKAIVTGFGYTRYWSPQENLRQTNPYVKLSENLKYLKTKVLDQNLCMQKQLTQPSNTIICAQADQNEYNWKEYQGTCKGDSGGPLVVHGVVIGVASHTISSHQCSEWYTPSFYTSVAVWKPFIELAMQDQTRGMITHTY